MVEATEFRVRVRTLDQEVFLSHLRIKVLDQAHISPALSHMDETWALFFVI